MNSQVLTEDASEALVSPAYFGHQPEKEYRTRPTRFEQGLAFLILLVSSPVLLTLGALIRLSGQKPIFFQQRVGFRGELFWIYKFQTMPRDGWKSAEDGARENLTKRAQLAIFKLVSRILRATGLDEFPQFANILKGDMQFIGPRPLMQEDFDKLPARRLERCAVPPGITGLAQINGGQELDSDSKLALDLYLIDNLSLRVAAKIVIRTILRISGFTSAIAKTSEDDLSLARCNLASPAVTSVTVVPERPRSARGAANLDRSIATARTRR